MLGTELRAESSALATELRSETQTMAAELRGEMQTGFATLRTEFIEGTNRQINQIKWMVTFAAGWTTLPVTLVGSSPQRACSPGFDAVIRRAGGPTGRSVWS